MTRDELLAEVVENLESPIGAVSFTSNLEDVYRTSVAGRRKSSMLIAGAIGMVILWIFILQHAIFAVPMMTMDALWRWAVLMGGLNLLIGAYVAVHAVVRSHVLRDGVTMALMAAMSLVVCTLLYFEESQLRQYGMFSYVMMPVACNNLVWLHFRQALAVTSVSFGSWAVLLAVVPDVDLQVRFVTTLDLVSVGAMALWANWRTDRGERVAFLWLTRERLHSELSRRQNDELREMSVADPLTGIANRRAFEQNFRRIDLLCATERVAMAVMMIDIDHFKLFNDHYGHLEGDRCLQSVAMALADQVRGPDDLVARLGGEEFAIVMPRLARGEFESVLERIRASIERLAIPHEGVRGDHRNVVTISIGGAMAEADDGEKRVALLTRADLALYRAKHDGRNRWALD